MQTKKMSLANIQGKLNRTEMKQIMAGSATGKSCSTDCNVGGAIWACYSDAGDNTGCYCVGHRDLSCS